MRIAIQFHDNDFNNTFYSVLRGILGLWRYDPELIENLSKDELVRYINEVSFGHYCIVTNFRNYNKTYIKEYLKLKKNDIKMANEELDLNYNIVILDTDLDYENNSPIYSLSYRK